MQSTNTSHQQSRSLVLVLMLTGVVAAAGTDATSTIQFETTHLPPRTTMPYPPLREIPEWLGTHVRIGHLPGYSERMVSEFLKAGFNVVTVNCLGNWDRVGPGASMYKPEEAQRADAYLRKVVDKTHAAGARSIWYIGPVQVPAFSPEFSSVHPDWLRVNADGKVDPKAGFGNIRSGYADWLCDQLAYVTRTYKPDGFWFDGYAPVHLHTYDEKTKRLFREHSGGHEIPTRMDPVHDPVSRQYIGWHERFFVDFADRIRGVIRKENSDTIIFANNSANRTWYFPSMYMGEYPASYCGAVDVSSVELYWDIPGDALYQQFCYAFLQGTTRGRGASVWIQPAEHGISGVASPIESQLRSLEGPPWGVYPEFVESAGREEYHKLHAENVKAREKWWINSQPVPYIGIVASEQTRTLYAQAALPVYFSHTLGAFRAIFEKHWPVRVLTEYDLEDAELQGVRVLFLPNVACLSDRAAEVIRRFVHAGGGLVATFETSLYDSDFNRRPDFALADVLHAKYVKTHVVQQRTENLYLTVETGAAGTSRPSPSSGPTSESIVSAPIIANQQATAWLGGDGPPPEQGELALIASAVEARPLTGAKTLCTYRLNSPDHKAQKKAAILASEYGRGHVVYLPASIDKAMFFYPDGYMRQMLADACLWAAGGQKPPLEVDGPLILSATFRRQTNPTRLVVHLLNDHSSYGRHSIYQKLAPVPEELQKALGFPDQSELRGTWPIREETIPLHDVRVVCRVPGISRARLQPENQDLPIVRTADGLEVSVPKVMMHTMLILE